MLFLPQLLSSFRQSKTKYKVNTVPCCPKCKYDNLKHMNEDKVYYLYFQTVQNPFSRADSKSKLSPYCLDAVIARKWKNCIEYLILADKAF